MPQPLSLSRAARLADVSRGELQRRIRSDGWDHTLAEITKIEPGSPLGRQIHAAYCRLGEERKRNR